MSDTDFAIPFFGFDNYDELDLSTPVASPTDPGGPQRSELAIPDSSGQGPSSSSLLYTVTWMMRLRKGRLMKLTEDTIEDIDIAPGAYWKQNLETKLASEAQERVPEPQYQHHDTIITVFTSKRGEPKFEKPFRRLEIDWTVIENKLRSWSDAKHSLRVTILLIYKESQQAATSKAGRGATKKHTAALEKLVTQQKATSTGAVWQDVYRLFLCQSDSCVNRGFYCWRHDSRHYKLDDKILEQLIDCAEEGMELKSHADVPERIREAIKAREVESVQRGKKRKAAEAFQAACCGGCRRHDATLDNFDRGQGHRADLVNLNLPMSIDKALESYSDWLVAQVDNVEWRESYRAAGAAAIKEGYELQWFCNNEAAGVEVLKENEIKRGIATQFVEKITKWVKEVNTG